MIRPTGYRTGVGYGLPPIGTAERLARDHDLTEFGFRKATQTPASIGALRRNAPKSLA